MASGADKADEVQVMSSEAGVKGRRLECALHEDAMDEATWRLVRDQVHT